MSHLLLDEEPLIIMPSLAKAIGLNESIVVQQLHYWLRKAGKVIQGRKWVYNTYKEWQEQFPFWSEVTVRRIITSLEKRGIVLAENFNEMRADKTKWYTIDYERLEGVISPCDQIDQSMRSNRSDGCDQFDQSNTREYTENTTEKEEEKEKSDMGVISPFEFYQKNIHPIIKPMILEEMNYWLDGGFFDQPEEILLESLKLIVRKEAKWDYANKALMDWKDQGLRTLESVRRYIKDRETRKPVNGNRGTNQLKQDKLPSSLEKQIERQHAGQHQSKTDGKTVKDDPELNALLQRMRSASKNGASDDQVGGKPYD
ncbi:DnaD domain-containing protein [Brevibacillus fulvus]|uniref:DnaD/phage-associated family protein n=1 Tax=Brevibacillus fulvus TaxID=1125967 RepID=A0A938Y4M4_9BACL|nr:DnaD domain protein [Brevibacillus fulvus]MBM7592214.1 DnaD/phage-associated family protein [Brevibacillus fulvus]